MSDNQVDLIAHMLDSSENDVQVRRAVYDTSRPRRRVVLAALGGGGVVALAGAGAVAATKVWSGPHDLRGSQQPAGVHSGGERSVHAGASDAGGRENGAVVFEAEVGDNRPVVAPGGTGAVIDETGHVVIVSDQGVIATSSDVTPEAVLVAGERDGQDVIAWTVGRVMSWWSARHGIQRVEHSRPLGLSAVAGGILVFDDEDWSGRLDDKQVTQIIAGNDSITIGVLTNGTTLAATADGVVTRTTVSGDMTVVQPTAPTDGVRVRRAAGVFHGHILLVWDDPGKTDESRSVDVTVVSVEDGATVSQGSMALKTALDAVLVRSARGAVFGTLMCTTNGQLREVPDDMHVLESVGDYVRVEYEGRAQWLDIEADDLTISDEEVQYQRRVQHVMWTVTGEHLRVSTVKEQ